MYEARMKTNLRVYDNENFVWESPVKTGHAFDPGEKSNSFVKLLAIMDLK